MADANGYLMVFADGPMSQIGNVETIASIAAGAPAQPGSFVIKRELFGWPLPDRLRTLCHPGTGSNAAMWGEGEETGLPVEITDSPNTVTYVKVRQSELPDDSMDRVMRGAEYKLVTDG